MPKCKCHLLRETCPAYPFQMAHSSLSHSFISFTAMFIISKGLSSMLEYLLMTCLYRGQGLPFSLLHLQYLLPDTEDCVEWLNEYTLGSCMLWCDTLWGAWWLGPWYNLCLCARHIHWATQVIAKNLTAASWHKNTEYNILQGRNISNRADRIFTISGKQINYN
jgi:hypothetical protein